MLTLVFASGIAPPDPRSGREVKVWRGERSDVLARGFLGGGLRWIDWPPFGVFGFTPGSSTVRVWPQMGARPDAVAGHFDRVMQPVILQALGWQTLHAGAVQGPGGVLAFCGARGAGKSTIAYALREFGWKQVADDALVLGREGDRVTAHPLPFTPRFWDESFRHFAGGSTVLPFRDARFDAQAAPLKAVFALQQGRDVESAARVARLPLVEAFAELLTHAHCFDAGDRSEARRLADDYLTMAQQVPVFSLTYQPNFGRLSEVLQAIVRTTETLDAAGLPEPIAST